MVMELIVDLLLIPASACHKYELINCYFVKFSLWKESLRFERFFCFAVLTVWIGGVYIATQRGRRRC